jgi:hypothetical protein
MPSVSEAFPSDFVRAGEDVVEGDVIVFLDGGRVERSEKYDRDQLVFRIRLANGNEKNLSVNKTSGNSLKEEYGDDTEEWEGKKAKASVVQQQVGKDLKPVIYLKPHTS